MGDNNLELDVQDFCFKQMCKLQIFTPPSDLITDTVNLILTSNKYGKIYVAAGTEIKSIDVDLLETIAGKEDANISQTVSNFEQKTLDTKRNIKHIGLSCDDLTISVVFNESNNLYIGCFDVRCFGRGDLSEVFFATGQLSSEADVYVRELEWNPEEPELAIVCLSNGIVSLLKIANHTVNILASLPSSNKYFSVNWSPRGKNFASGRDDGKIMLFDKKLTLKKELPCPEELSGVPHKVVKVRWIMSHNFAAVYVNSEDEEPPKFICIVNQKDGPSAFMNMEDVYFGLNEERQLCFYIETIPAWNMLVTMASNAFEAVVIGKMQSKWMRWALNDSSRAEMPLSEERDDTFPCGIAINRNSALVINEGEKTLPPMPVLLMISTHGVLSAFQMVNKMEGVNYEILVKQGSVSLDGMRMPFASQQNQTTSVSLKGLPKPFKTSTLETSTGPVQSKEVQSTSSTNSQQTPFSFIKPSTGSSQASANASISFGGPSIPFRGSGLFTQTTENETSFAPTNTWTTSTASTPASNQASGSKPALIFGNAVKDIDATGVKEGAAKLDSIAPSKPFDFSSKSSLFAPPSGQPSSIFGGSATVSTASQLTVAKGAQAAPVASPFGIPQQPVSQSQAGVNNALQRTGAPIISSVLTRPVTTPGLSTDPGSRGVATAFNRNDKNSSLQSQVAEEKKTTETQQKVPAGRVPPESRLLQPMEAPRPPEEIAKQRAPLEKPPQQLKPDSSEGTKRPTTVKNISKIENMSKELGYDIMNSINEEIKSFAKELVNFKKDMADCKNIVESIGTKEEMTALQVNTLKFSRKLQEFQDCQKEHQSECSQLKSRMMKSFDNFEQARIHHASANDPLYRNILKVRALDPVASRQQKELRSQINYLSALISDAYESLDVEMEQAKASASRKLKANNIHNIYIATESIDKIIDNLARKIESISLNATDEDLTTHQFSFRKTFLRDSRLNENEERLSFNAKSTKIADGKLRLSPMKKSQLDSFISKKLIPPSVESTYKDHSIMVKPRAASTPAVEQSSRYLFGNPPDTPSTHLKLETLDESSIEKDHLPKEENPVGLEKKQLPLTSTAAAPKSELPLAFGMKNKPMEEKPKSQSGFMFQAVASVPSSLPVYGSTCPFKGSDRTVSQLGSFATTSSHVSSNVSAFGVKKEVVSGQDVLKMESLATTSSIANSSQGFSKPVLSDEKVPTSSSATIQNKHSSFAKQLGTIPVFANTTISASSEVRATSDSLSTTSTVFASSFVFAKPKAFSAANNQNAPTQSGISSFQFSQSLSTDDQTKVELKSKDQISKEVQNIDAQFNSMSSKPPPTTFSIASSEGKVDTSSVSVVQPFRFVTESSRDKGLQEIASLTTTKVTNSSLFGTPAEFSSSIITKSSENSAGLCSFAPKPSLFGGAVTTTTTTTVQPFATIQGFQGQKVLSTASSHPSGGNAELSIRSTLPTTENDPKLTTVAALEKPLPSFTSKVADNASALHVSTGSSTLHVTTAPLSGSQTTTSASAIPAFTSKVSGNSTSLFSTANTVTISSFSTNNKSEVPDAAAVGAFAAKTSESSSSLITTNTETVTSSLSGQSSVFGKISAQSSASMLTTSSVSTKTPVFGIQSSVVETTGSFGSRTSAGSSNLFGTPSSGTPSLFNVSTQPKTTVSGIFGGSSTQTAPVSGIFGGSSTQTAPVSGIFGGSSTQTASVFGSQTNTTSSGLFGQTVSSAPTVFGQQQTISVFGTQPNDAKPSGLFSTPAANQNTAGLFGAKTSATSGGIFGSVSSGQPAFGSQKAPSSSSGMGFGGFGLGGKPTNDPSKNPFGSIPSTSSATIGSSGLFGFPSSSSPFASAHTSPLATKGAFSKGFGAGFMGGSPSAQSTFGSNATAGNASFGGGATFGGAPAFGSTPSFGGSPSFGATSAFGGGVSSGPTFGSGTSTFAQPSGFGALAQQAGPSFGDLNTQAGVPAFGGMSATQNQVGFGGAAQQSSAFGQTGAMFGQSSSPKGSSFSSWR